MKDLIAKFSALKPQERRFFIVVGAIVFLVFNYFEVWPYFGDLRRQKDKMRTAQGTLLTYRTECARTNGYVAVIKRLTESEPDVQAEDQAVHFDSAYRDHAIANKVVIISSSRPSISTNQFFINHEVGVNAQAKEEDLVNFLYKLGSGGSMIRVKAVSLHPDPSHQQLAAGLTIVASYKRTKPGPVPVAKPATPSTPAAPAAKPKPLPGPPPAGKTPVANKPVGLKPAITNKTATPNLLKRP
jgi:hypothetical protein